MSASVSDSLQQVQGVLGKLDRAVKLYALRLDSPEARRLGTELYYELLHVAVLDEAFALGVNEQGLVYADQVVLAADAAPWVFNLWAAGFRHIAIEPGLEENELIWFLELLSDEEPQDLAWRAWAQNLAQIRFVLAPLPPLSREMDVELSHLLGLLETASAQTPRSVRIEDWSEESLKDFTAPDPKLRHNILRELQGETMPFMGQRLLLRLLEVFQSAEPNRSRGSVEDLGWVLWHFAHQPELRASGRVLRDLQQLCHDAGLQAFGEDALPQPEAHALAEVAAAVDALTAPPSKPIVEQEWHELEVAAAKERMDEIVRQHEVSAEDVKELLRQAERAALPEASGVHVEAEDLALPETAYRPYKGVKFTVSSGPAKEAPPPPRERRRDSGFWKIDTNSAGDDVIDSLFSEVFGEEEEAPARPAAPQLAEVEPEVMDVEESSIDLSALGFDPALLLKKPAAPATPLAAEPQAPSADDVSKMPAAPFPAQAPRPAAPSPAALPSSADPEPDRPELLWAGLDLDAEQDASAPPVGEQRPAPPAIAAPPPPAAARRDVRDPQLAETQKLRLVDIEAAIAAERAAAAPAATPTPEPVSKARVLRAQGRLVEARHLLHRYLKEAPEDRAAEEEFRRIQHELRVHCAYQMRNEDLVPQLQLPPGSPHLQALLQAPGGSVLRRVNGSSTLREIRAEMQLPPKEFERHMTSLLEWGFVTLTSRKR
jgi:hypothetical protein